MQGAYATLQAERRHLAQQIQTSEALHLELRTQVETTSGALVQTRRDLAVLSAEKLQFQSRIAALATEVQTLLNENKELIIDKARLEGMQSRPVAQPGTT